MGSVVRLWNPRSNPRLQRYWISTDEQILISGETGDQAGVLSLRPEQGRLCARLRAGDCDVEELVAAGNDVDLRINGLKLCVDVKAVEDERMLVAFGIRPGATVSVTLESGHRMDPDTREPAEDGFHGEHPGISLSAARH